MKVSDRFSRSFPFDDGLPSIYEENGKMGVKMSNGVKVIPPIYNTIKELDMLTAQYMVEFKGKYGVLEIDPNGEVSTKLEIEYDLFKYVKDVECYLIGKNDKFGIWHNDLHLPCECNKIQLLNNNDLLICKNGKYGVWDWHICVPCDYDEITLVEYEKECGVGELKWTGRDEYYLLKQGDKYGLWSIDTQLLPTIYDEIAPPIDEWGIKVKKNDVWGYLDKEHNFTTDLSKVPLKWEDLSDVGRGISF